MARKHNPSTSASDRAATSQSGNVPIFQRVTNPVGNAENTGKGRRERKPPSLVTSGAKTFNQKVYNPVGRKAKSGSDQGNV